jgi:cell division protein FtsZ
MKFNALTFYERKRIAIDLFTAEDKLPLFILFFVYQNGALTRQDLDAHLKTPSGKVDQIITHLVESNLLGASDGLIHATKNGRAVLTDLGLLEELRGTQVPLVATAIIKVIGVGGGGCNTITRLMQQGIESVELIAINTDAKALEQAAAHFRLLIGEKLTRGCGVHGDPSLGRLAAIESRDILFKAIQGAHMVFITAGMGGGTGSGATPIIAKIAKEVGALTIAVVTKPFSFEGTRRHTIAENRIDLLEKLADSTVVIANDLLLSILAPSATVDNAFACVDDIVGQTIGQTITSIVELVTVPGLINLDFLDLETILGSAGLASLAIGYGTGENRAVDAAKAATTNLTLDVALDSAKSIVLSIRGPDDLTLSEVNEAAEVIRQAVDPDANIILGVAHDPEIGDGVAVILIATGVSAEREIEKIRESLPGFPEGAEDLNVPPFLRGAPRERHRIVARIK